MDIGCPVKVISWNISATRLLVATESNLELWNYLPKDETAEGTYETITANTANAHCRRVALPDAVVSIQSIPVRLTI